MAELGPLAARVQRSCIAQRSKSQRAGEVQLNRQFLHLVLCPRMSLLCT